MPRHLLNSLDFSVEEISRRLFVSRSTVEKELKKARQALKAKLKDEGYEV